MPLTMAQVGQVNEITRVGGKQDTKKFLENLGFIAGSTVTIISKLNGNMIVNIKDSRVAINEALASKIWI